MFKAGSIKLGTVSKTHGTAGQVVIRADKRIKLFDSVPEWSFIELDGGLVPFRIDPAKCFLKDPNHIVLGWMGKQTPDDTHKFLQKNIWFPGVWDDYFQSSSMQPDEYEGFVLTDCTSGFSGKITGYENFSGNRLFEVETPSQSLLIPAKKEWIRSIDQKNKTIVMELPAGLLDQH